MNSKKLIYYHQIRNKHISVLSQFSFPTFYKGKFYAEVIDWSAPKLSNGVLNTKILYELDLNTHREQLLPVMIENELIKNPIFKQYFSQFNEDIIFTNSLNSEIRIFNLQSFNLHKTTFKENRTISYNISDIESEIDKSNEELVINDLYSPIIVDTNNACMYRLISKSAPKINPNGYISSLSDKKIDIHKYDIDFNLNTEYHTNLSGSLPDYYVLENQKLFAINYSNGKIVLLTFNLK
jgi:hypothetical protein